MTTLLPLTELLLALYLLLVLPGRQLWRTLRPADSGAADAKPPRPRLESYRRNIIGIAIPLLVLAADMVVSGRGAAALGLDLPLSVTGGWCLGVSALALLVLTVGSEVWERRMPPQKRAEMQAKVRTQVDANGAMPRNAEELRGFIVLTLFVGCGWELLYRGFLLLVLAPLTGLPAAIALAAVAYGAAHGYQGARQFSGSIVSAFLFTIAYSLSHSLWWLMLIHTTLGLSMAVTAYRASRGGAALEVNTV
jgi:membrane protease YdiL (CAAX protease family)